MQPHHVILQSRDSKGVDVQGKRGFVIEQSDTSKTRKTPDNKSDDELTLATTIDPDLLRKNLDAVNIRHLAEWDVLAFIYRHGTNLVSADHIARLLGHGKTAVGSALDTLSSKSLIKRSRSSQGVRFYQISPAIAAGSRRQFLEELMSLTEQRRGRILLIAHLRQRSGKERRGHGLHLA